MPQGLYTNRSARSDFVQNGIYEFLEDGMDVFFASAFFTEFEVIEELLRRDCRLRIIVRLGFPTSPNALSKLMHHRSIEARYFTSKAFHPKVYIFGDKGALVGSANLTKSAIFTNQEVVVSVSPDDPRFDELTVLFSDYWDQAAVLDSSAIANYQKLYSQYQKASDATDQFDEQVAASFGDMDFDNIKRGEKKKSKKTIFLDTYKKSYQEAVTAFNYVQEEYLKFPRKVAAEAIPLRLEIDSFFSFVRDRYATSDAWESRPLGWTDSMRGETRQLIRDWLATDWPHFEDRIVTVNYPKICTVFASGDAIDAARLDEIVEALCVLHSFHDRLRFYKGGLETLKKDFVAANAEDKIRHTLKYLLHGPGDAVERMANCTFDEQYKLAEFGQANVQEIMGWINGQDLPVVNGRTTKVLRYLGFNVRQISA